MSEEEKWQSGYADADAVAAVVVGGGGDVESVVTAAFAAAVKIIEREMQGHLRIIVVIAVAVANCFYPDSGLDGLGLPKSPLPLRPRSCS